ncbi:MAG TPA: CopG family transcriptional regulator [bacterium]|nr:CopG family transcriptional regulator [bacterium]HPQ65317.1 CopG family transcriptional regulator [bacterium]
MEREPKATIKIPRPLYNHLKSLIAGSGFDSVTDFVVYVLRDIASAPAVPEISGRPYSPNELEAVKTKLRRLGYLD